MAAAAVDEGSISAVVAPEEPVMVPETQLFYTPRGQLRECTQWDERGHRFLVSLFEGGIGAVPYQPGQLIQEQVLVSEPARPGLSNLGFRIDYPQNRVVSCASDKVNNLLSTIVAYDYTTWETLFVVELAGPEAGKSLADDLTIAPDGNIYVTDTYNGKIWKVRSDGSEFHVFSDSPLYKVAPTSSHVYDQWRLNGICYHPDGFLLSAHLGAHALFKISMDAKRVIVVAGLEGKELLGDGMVLQNKHTLAMTGLDLGVHLLCTKDNWESATVTHSCPPPPGRLTTSASLKHGHIFVGCVNGVGDPYTCTIGQPIFKPFIPDNPKLSARCCPGPPHVTFRAPPPQNLNSFQNDDITACWATLNNRLLEHAKNKTP